MTKIRARCPGCGDVEFGVAQIVVLGSVDGPSRTYLFSCPACTRPVRRTALPEVIELLLSAGVRLEAETRRAGGRWASATDREILRFRALLNSPDWFRQLEALDKE